MKVSIIIPNFNGRKLLQRNLPQVINRSKGAEIIVVDDASTDGSVEMLKSKYPKVKVVARKENSGFAASVNDGVNAARGELIYLLNSDCEPQAEYLDPLIRHFTDELLFAAGSFQKNNQKDISTDEGSSTGKFSRGFLVHKSGDCRSNKTLWVFGGAGMFRKSIWQKLEGMCTLYDPFYWEDIDLSYRAQKAGYTITFEPKSMVIHSHEMGAIQKQYDRSTVKRIAYRNQIIFVWVNITDGRYLLNHVFFLFYQLVKSLFESNLDFVSGFIMAVKKGGQIIGFRTRNSKMQKVSDRQVLDTYLC